MAKNAKDNSFAYAGMGTVQFGQGSYTESITHSSIKSLLDKTLLFTYEIKGSTFYKHGKFPDWTLEEVWERVR